MRKKSKLDYDGGNSGKRIANDSAVAPMVRYDGVWDVFCVDTFGRNLAQVAVTMFSCLI
jgi:hypothetical protein